MTKYLYYPQMGTKILESGYELFRYDLAEPPNVWTTEFHNPQYCSNNGIKKNQAGNFFFFNSKYMAKMTGLKALRVNSNKGFDKLWISQCKTTSNIKLLDISMHTHISALLLDFYLSNINIFTEKLKATGFESDKNNLYTFRNHVKRFYEVILEANYPNNQDSNKEIDTFIKYIESYYCDNLNIGLFTQRLTDFDNGSVFRKILQEKKYEGYIFNESNHNEGSDTICLFSSDKLTSPTNFIFEDKHV